jgi:hypothetical protein
VLILDGIEAEHAQIDTTGGSGVRVGVSVVGEDDEFQSGTRGSCGDVVGGPAGRRNDLVWTWMMRLRCRLKTASPA